MLAHHGGAFLEADRVPVLDLAAPLVHRIKTDVTAARDLGEQAADHPLPLALHLLVERLLERFIENGKVQDEFFSASSQQLSQNTLFPAASMSKWITALGIMTLVQDGRLDLDESVLEYLVRWQPVEGVFDWQQVTVRQLLSHTSGLNDGLGFGDYQPDEQLPSLEESLQDFHSRVGCTKPRHPPYVVGLQRSQVCRAHACMLLAFFVPT